MQLRYLFTTFALIFALSTGVVLFRFQETETKAQPVEVKQVEQTVLDQISLSSLSTDLFLSLPRMSYLNSKKDINVENLTQSFPRSKPASLKSSIDIWQSLVNDMQMDHYVQTPQVQNQIKKLLAEKNKFNKILQNASPFIAYIYMQTKSHGLPAEIALIPFIESEYNPRDHSKKGAVGLWQIMLNTARLLGVKVNGLQDGRQNLTFATHAALSHLQDLKKKFKSSWVLAIAAYNCGQYRVEKAVRRAGTQSFWKLSLPTETLYYIPRLFAVAEIISHPTKYHVEIPKVLATPVFSQYQTNQVLRLSEFAKKSGISISALQKFNPHYRNGFIPKGTTLFIPLFL